ncbi:MAG: N-acetyltransferase family protein [Hyphomicrobiaceae bacterium]
MARFFEPFDRSMPRFVVTIGDEIAGMFALKIGWMFGMYLNVLAVFPAHQGRGIGSAVLSWLEERGRANGDRNQFVVTSAFNCGGLRLYKRHGFEPVAELPGLINETETEILLRKRL